MMSHADPISYFLEDIEQHGRSPRTVSAYERVLRSFEEFLVTSRDTTPKDAHYRDCMAFVHTLRSDYAESTVASYASYLNRYYSYLVRVGQHDANPMELVLEEMNESIDSNPSRRDISLDDMRQFVASIRHPLHRAIVLTLAKTGMRSGELCNLDVYDLNITHEGAWWEPRPQISEKQEALYVSPEHTVGEKSRGAVRNATNKRMRETTIPIDGELRHALLQWLSVRPDSRCESQPLFTGTSERWGKRLTINIVHHTVQEYAREFGWYHTGVGPAENVTPHYFRHFFTTHLRDRTGDRGIVKYLRGDVASDIIETYTHDWNDRVRETYLAHIYSLTGIPPQPA